MTDKTAQQRGFFNKLRERTNFTGRALETISPEFRKTMNRLRNTDERIRNLAADARSLIKAAKQQVSRRDYLGAAASLSVFHERARYIAAELNRLQTSVDEKQYQILLDQFDDRQKEQLFGYNPKGDVKLPDETLEVDDASNFAFASLKKQAGMSDWWLNISDPVSDLNFADERARAMRAFEKRFATSFFKELKARSIEMVNDSESFLRELLISFKHLAKAVARRKLGAYLEASKRFVERFDAYHSKFANYYTKHIAPLKAHHDKVMEDKRKKQEEQMKVQQKNEEMAQRRQQYLSEQSVRPGESLREQLKEQMKSGPLTRKPTTLPNEKEELMYDPKRLQELVEGENLPIDLSKEKAANDEFLDRLTVLAEEDDPRLFALEVLDHSEKLEDTNPETSLKLLSIAEGIIEEYKTAGVFDFFKGKSKEEQEEEPVPLA